MGIFHLLVYFLVLVYRCFLSNAVFDNITADLSTSWKNNPSLLPPLYFDDGSRVTPILLKTQRRIQSPKFACGFMCNGTCDSYLLAIFIGEMGMVRTEPDPGLKTVGSGSPQVVWSANRNNPVRINSTLQLTSNGDLVLKDVDGTVAWSTDTANKSVAGLNLTEMGNLVLFDTNNSIVWQSFDHPTDALVLGQKLIAGQKLIPSVSPTNWTQLNLLSLSVIDEGMYASVDTNPVQVYFEWLWSNDGTKTNREPTYVILLNDSFALFASSFEQGESAAISFSESSSPQYAKFWYDGHLRVHQWKNEEWQVEADMLLDDECSYPTVCGNYGICSNGQCSCSAETGNGKAYFSQIDYRHPSLGCSVTTPLSCQGLQNHSFIELTDTAYSSFSEDLKNVDSESCRNACSRNCSCKAVIFRYDSDSANGSCYLPNQIFSLEATGKYEISYNSTIYLKVQNASAAQIAPTSTAESIARQQKKKRQMEIILISSVVSFLLILIGIVGVLAWKKRNVDDLEEDYLDPVPGLPRRFSYQELKDFTDNFSKMLGKGGFGSVFEGTMADGTKFAVKRLKDIGEMKKSFLAEVESIGSIHHVNLVRLVGFCANKSNMLLVYEFMCNGSLDKWIFNKTPAFALDWKQRKKIILDIAKGLNYLHEDCAKKIIHLDIKPQNILLDDKLNAKISDFGLSKPINRDESKVVMTMRGTHGYLAPEWSSSTVTEKADIYSFGVVVLEMLCGRRNVDRSQPEETMHLLAIFEKKAEEDKLFDLVDDRGEDVQLHREEISKLMKIAAWCLQKDYVKRPSMSMVVKVLQGALEVEQNLDYHLSNPAISVGCEATSKESTLLLPSVLSGPR